MLEVELELDPPAETVGCNDSTPDPDTTVELLRLRLIRCPFRAATSRHSRSRSRSRSLDAASASASVSILPLVRPFSPLHPNGADEAVSAGEEVVEFGADPYF